MSITPGMFYTYVITAFILNVSIGFNLSWTISYIIGEIFTIIYCVGVITAGKRMAE